MSKRELVVGSTSHIEQIVIDDSSSSTGAGLTGLLYNSSGLTAKYKREGDSSWSSITLATMAAGTWVSGGFIESSSGAGGEYEFGVPNAAIASGADSVVIVLYGATNMAAVRIEIELVAVDKGDSADFGLTALTGHTPQTQDHATNVNALESRLTIARSSYLDKLNIGGNVASSTEVNAIQNTTRSKAVNPSVIERPDSGSVTPEFKLFLYDTDGNMEDADTAPILESLTNSEGTDRSGNASAVSTTGTGQYQFTYTVADSHVVEILQGIWSYTEGGNVIKVPFSTQVLDTTAVDYTSADRTRDDAIKAFVDASTAQTGDSYSIVSSGTHGNSALKTIIDSIKAITDAQGGDGSGLTALGGMSAAMKAEVKIEADSALTDYDPPTKAELDLAESNIINAVNAVNTGAARYISVHTPAAYEVPESGSVTYAIEIRTFDGDGDAVNADSTPTVSIFKASDGTDYSSDLSAITNPATGVYRLNYTVESTDDSEGLRIDASATIATVVRTTSAYPVATNAEATDFTTSDRGWLQAIFDKLPSKSRLTGTANSDGDIQLNEATGTLPANSLNAAAISADASLEFKTQSEGALQTYKLHKLLDQPVNPGEVGANSIISKITDSGLTPNFDNFVNGTESLKAIAATVGVLPTLGSIQAGVATELQNIHLDHIFANAYNPDSKPGVATALFNSLIEDNGSGTPRYTIVALEQGPSGGGGGGGDWTATEKAYFRYVFNFPGTQTDPATTPDYNRLFVSAKLTQTEIPGVNILNGITEGNLIQTSSFSRFSVSITLGIDVSTRTGEKIKIGFKQRKSDTDDDAYFIISETTGLLVSNKTSVGLTAANASIVVTDESTGTFTLTIEADELSKIGKVKGGVWGVKWFNASGEPVAIKEGTFENILGVVRALS